MVRAQEAASAAASSSAVTPRRRLRRHRLRHQPSVVPLEDRQGQGQGGSQARRARDEQATDASQRAAFRGVFCHLGYSLGEWTRNVELEDSIIRAYDGYIRRTIQPALGEEPAKKISARILERFYTELSKWNTPGSNPAGKFVF